MGPEANTRPYYDLKTLLDIVEYKFKLNKLASHRYSLNTQAIAQMQGFHL